MILRRLFVMIMLLPVTAWGLVGVGGYVPFGFETQKHPEGGHNTMTFHPSIGFNTIYPLPYQHVALPEFGVVFHRNKFDEIKKRTYFVLWDVGRLVGDKLVLRYGLGTFMTRIGGDGGTRSLPNGDGTMEFAVPDQTRTSYNTTINLGMDLAIDRNYSLKAEMFVFGVMRSRSRSISYTIAMNYYL